MIVARMPRSSIRLTGLSAISGMTHITLGDAQVDLLVDLIHWLATQPEVLHLQQTGDSAGDDLPEPVSRHFEATGSRALYALPSLHSAAADVRVPTR